MGLLAAIDWEAVAAIVQLVVVVASLGYSVFMAGAIYRRISDGVAQVKELVGRVADHEKRIEKLESPRCLGA